MCRLFYSSWVTRAPASPADTSPRAQIFTSKPSKDLPYCWTTQAHVFWADGSIFRPILNKHSEARATVLWMDGGPAPFCFIKSPTEYYCPTPFLTFGTCFQLLHMHLHTLQAGCRSFVWVTVYWDDWRSYLLERCFCWTALQFYSSLFHQCGVLTLGSNDSTNEFMKK